MCRFATARSLFRVDPARKGPSGFLPHNNLVELHPRISPCIRVSRWHRSDVLCLDVDVPGLPIRQAVVEIFRGQGLRFLGYSQILRCDSSILFVVPGHRDFNRCQQECPSARIVDAAWRDLLKISQTAAITSTRRACPDGFSSLSSEARFLVAPLPWSILKSVAVLVFHEHPLERAG